MPLVFILTCRCRDTHHSGLRHAVLQRSFSRMGTPEERRMGTPRPAIESVSGEEGLRPTLVSAFVLGSVDAHVCAVRVLPHGHRPGQPSSSLARRWLAVMLLFSLLAHAPHCLALPCSCAPSSSSSPRLCSVCPRDAGRQTKSLFHNGDLAESLVSRVRARGARSEPLDVPEVSDARTPLELRAGLGTRRGTLIQWSTPLT